MKTSLICREFLNIITSHDGFVTFWIKQLCHGVMWCWPACSTPRSCRGLFSSGDGMLVVHLDIEGGRDLVAQCSPMSGSVAATPPCSAICFAWRATRDTHLKKKNQPKETRGHPGVIRADIPAENFGQGAQNPGKTSIWARISMTPRRGLFTTLRGFQKLRSETLG